MVELAFRIVGLTLMGASGLIALLKALIAHGIIHKLPLR